MSTDPKSSAVPEIESKDRFTLQDFLDEYAKGSQSFIDLDPRIDFT